MTETETIEFDVPNKSTVEEIVDVSGYDNTEMFLMDELDRVVASYDDIQDIEANESIEVTLPKDLVDDIDELLHMEGYDNTKELLEYVFKMIENMRGGGGGGISKKMKPKP